jgi:phage repressor protein C with HTH and peptisase S24 domain
MLTHTQIWTAIDALARRYGLSPSGLAKRAGLDATAFNRSKRVTPEGRPRWPTTESMAKVLAATGASLDEFMHLLDDEGPALRKVPQPIPLIGLTQAGAGGFFDDGGFPVGGGWDQIGFPRVEDDNAYALEVTGESMQPLYRDGDILIVSPTCGKAIAWCCARPRAK